MMRVLRRRLKVGYSPACTDPENETETWSGANAKSCFAKPDALPVKLQIPLKDIAPGAYTCQINVVDIIGRKFAFPRAELVIAP